MSPFEALSPDQRAVVQLVLQQGRSYAELSALLGISEDAVRTRALRGLEALAPGSTPTVAEEDRALIADFLLGQQPVSARERTRELLVGNLAANDWALDVAEELDVLAPDKVPDIPDPEEPSLVQAARGAESDIPAPPPRGPVSTPAPPHDEDEEDFFGDEPAVEEPRPADTSPPLAEQDFITPPPSTQRAATARKPTAPARSSRIGGALLIAGVAALLAALVIFLIARGDDDDPASDEPATTQEASPTAAPEDQRQLLGQVNLRGSGGALGIAHLFLRADNKIEFELRTEKLQPNRNDAYAVWLVSRNKAERLGFSQGVGEDGNLQTRAELPANAADFEELVISRETSDKASRPTKVVLRGSIAKALGGGG